MKTRKPIQAKSTERILNAVVPGSFKMVNDKSSNGYKYFNLLYGAEFDEASDRARHVYNDSFIDSFDVSRAYELYQVDLSGAPNISTLTGDEISIKITTEDEFYNGDPTRVIYNNRYRLPINTETYSGSFQTDNSFGSGFFTECWSNISGITGLEYFRSDSRGSGYFIVFTDHDQELIYQSGIWPSYKLTCNKNFQSSDDFNKKYGFFTGVRDQNYQNNDRYEILTPINSRTLSGLYPSSRKITDESGVIHSIDHYTPYNGYTRNDIGEYVAVVDYSGAYYYDSIGEKIYYRTALNNPYGYNNYNVAYLDLEHAPISGTLKVYDIDIIDISGNAIEIDQAGTNIYYYKSDMMLIGSGGAFDPIYLGYDGLVPSGQGFSSYSEGKPTTLHKVISWDYLHEGGGIEHTNHQYIDGSGSITDRIKINNPQTRYMVEYKYVDHNKSKYISSLESNKYVSLDTTNPTHTTSTTSGNLENVPYTFTKNKQLRELTEQARILTFDGLKIRPYKYLHKIDFEIPLLIKSSNLTNLLYVNANNKYIGFTNEFVPVESANERSYYMNCPFDQNVYINTVTELDLAGKGNTLSFENTGTNDLYKINYGTYYGKKIIRGTGDSYFKQDNRSFIKDNLFIHLGFKVKSNQTGVLFDIHDTSIAKYITAEFNKQGRISISGGGYTFYGRTNILFNDKHKEIMIKYVADDVSSSVPTFKLFYKEEEDISFKEIDMWFSETDAPTVSSTYFHVFKNFAVDADFVKVFYEVQ